MRYKNYWTTRRRQLFRQFVKESLKNRWMWIYSERLVVADLEAIYYDVMTVTSDDIDVSVVQAQI